MPPWTASLKRGGRLQGCLAADEKREGPNSLRVASHHNNLRGIAEALADVELGLEHAEQVVETYRNVLGPEHPDTLVARQYSAQLLTALGAGGGGR